jgi:hypothetical protein
LDLDKERTLVLARQESGWRYLVHMPNAKATAAERDQAERGLADQSRNHRGVAVAVASMAFWILQGPRRPVRSQSRPQSAGLSVSALIAEMIIETETATANCW